MKTEVQKEKAEAELLAQNGFNITIGKRKFTIKPLTFGAIVKANQYATEIKMNIKGGEISSMVQNYQENTDPLMKFIAVAILGPYGIIPFVSILSAIALIATEWKSVREKADEKARRNIDKTGMQMFELALKNKDFLQYFYT